MHPHRRLLRDRHGGRARANFNLVAPLAFASAEPTDMRTADTSGQLDLFGSRDASGAVSRPIGLSHDLRQGDVDSANDRSSTPTTPTTPGTRTSTTATRTTGTRTTRTGVARSADRYDAVFSYARLLDAWLACRRNKRNTASALAFEARLEQNIAELRGAFAEGTYAPGRSICFVITRPKPREVWAAPFRDRIGHHLLYLAVADRFERAFIADSCACIPGRGTLYAARRLEAKVRSITRNWKRPAHYLKLDLANFFVSIDKNKLRDLLAVRIREPELMDLAERILFHDPRVDVELQSPPDRLALVPSHKSLLNQPVHLGLPIGNLSSQFFANVYLDVLDQFVKHRLHVRHYVRYVDDFVLLHESPQQLNAWRAAIEAFLPERLGVRLNPAKTILQPIDRGIDFVGHLIKPWRRSIRPRTLGEVIDKYLLEIVPELAERTQEDYRAYCAKLKHGLGHMLPDEIEITDLYDYHEAREAPTRANREITVLGSIYRHAIRWRAATRNPTAGFLYAPESPRERRVTGSERRRFAAGFVPDWMRGYLALKYLTGRRQGELLKLGLFSERDRGIAFRILKKRRYRELLVEWTPRLRLVWNWLKAMPRPKDSTVIFPASKGKRRGQALSSRGFKSAWQRAQAKWIAAGNEAFWEHDIRAATATASKSDEAARELLDHETVRTTKSYRRGESRVKPLR